MNLIEETNRQFQELTKVFMNCIFSLSNTEDNVKQIMRLKQIINQTIIDIKDENYYNETSSIRKQQTSQPFQIIFKGKQQQPSKQIFETKQEHQQFNIVNAINKITIKQPNEEYCFLCHKQNKKQISSKIAGDRQYFYHVDCLSKAKDNHIPIDKLASLYRENICQICQTFGAYYQCENCQKWYHYQCLSEKYQNNTGICDCPCKPIDIFNQLEQFDVKKPSTKKKVKVDHVSDNQNLFFDIQFKKN